MFVDWLKNPFRGYIFTDDEKEKKSGGITESLFGFLHKEDEIYNTVKFPSDISAMSKNTIREIIRHQISTYRHIAYPKKSEDFWDKQEWHSWQVSFMLIAIRDKFGVMIHHKEELVYPEMLEIENDDLKQICEHLLHKYQETVNLKKTKDELQKDLIWTPREVGFMFLYLSTLNNK